MPFRFQGEGEASGIEFLLQRKHGNYNGWISYTYASIANTFDAFNDGEAYEKLPRFIPYFALPLGMALLLFRTLQASWRVLTGQQGLLIAGHEVEDLMDETTSDEGVKS